MIFTDRIHWLTSAVWYCYIKFWDFNILIKNVLKRNGYRIDFNDMRRDRACMQSIFWIRSPQKTYILSPRVGHLRQCKSPRVGDFVALFWPHGGAFATRFAKMTNARQTPGEMVPMELIETLTRSVHSIRPDRHEFQPVKNGRRCKRESLNMLLLAAQIWLHSLKKGQLFYLSEREIINAGVCVDEKLTFKLNGEICCSKDWFKAAKSNSEIYTIILF